MSIELDRNGVPQYAGQPEYFNEYEERAWDLYHGRTGEKSKQALCGSSVWRDRNESMANYVTRRRKEFAELQEVSATTTISEDIQAALILRFCGISMKEQAAVLASNKNEYKLAGIEYALRAQYPAVHRQQDRRADRRERSAYAYAASEQDENQSELDQIYYEDEDEDGYYQGEEDDYEHGEDDEFDIENYVAENLDELGTEEAEALALVLQSRNKIFNKKKPPRRVTSSFHGRGKHIANLKKRTQCSDCHQFGHWQGDDGCPRRSSRKPTSVSPAKKPAQNYFALEKHGGNDDDSEPSEVFMVLKGEMEHVCEHVADDACEKVVRGANKTTRYITCRECDRHFTLAHRNKGFELWSYFMKALMGTKWGRFLSRKEFARRIALVADTLMVQGRLPSTYRRRTGAPAARRLSGKQRLFGRLPARGDGPRAPTPAAASAASSARPSATGSAPAAPPTPGKRIIKVDLTQGDPEPKPGPELAFLYGIPLHQSIELVEFPDLDGVDQLNPVPYPAEVINFGTHKGRTFQDAASDPALIWHNKWALDQVLGPEAEDINLYLYRYAYFLYAIVKIARGKFNVAPQQMIDGDKRRLPADNDWMEVNAGGFTIPIRPNIHQPDVISTYECSVMAATTGNAFSAHDNDADAMLAIIDTGCTRTMHGESWRAAFERKLARRGLQGDVADFVNIGVYNLKLHHTKVGHPAVNLLDLPNENYETADWAALTTPEDHNLEYYPEKFHVGITYVEESSVEPLPSFLDIEIGETTDDECLQTVVDHDYGPDVFAAGAIEWGGKRNLTNKKSKKLEHSLQAIAVQDEVVQAVVEKHPPRARLPAGAGTWVKQTYAGQMGLTVLMATMGLSVGVPLDKHTGWDATTRLGRQRYDAEITNEEPYCLVVSHPCSPWGNWSRFNMARCPETERKILAKREANRPILRQVDSSVDSRVRRGFHVALEHPQGSEAFDQPEMSRIRSLLDKGILRKVTFDGCQVGYRDAESGLAHRKPMMIITTMDALVEALSDKKCSCTQHEQLKGRNKFGPRTLQAAEWPEELNHIVARSIVQQAIVDNATDTDWPFPAEDGQYVFNYAIQLGTFHAYDAAGNPYFFMNCICEGTNVYCMGPARGSPTARATTKAFTTSWTPWAGYPEKLTVDLGKEWMKDFASNAKAHGVQVDLAPLETPHLIGKCERRGGIWKEIWRRTVADSQVTGLDDVEETASIVTQVKNELGRRGGFSPSQWVLGSHGPRVPGSLLQNDEAQRLEVIEASLDPQSAMARAMALREAARIARVRLDSDDRVKRAILRKARPSRGPFNIGAIVYFRRSQTRVGESPEVTHRWFGPARVIGHEVRDPRHLSRDADEPVGTLAHAVWLRYGHTTVLAAPESLRFASEDELLAMHTYVNPDLLPLRSLMGARHYIDIRADAAAASPAPMPRPQQRAAGHGGVVGGALGSAGPGPDVNFDFDEFNTEAVDKPVPDDEMGAGLERGEKRGGLSLTQLDKAMRNPERLDWSSIKKPRTFQGYVEEEFSVMEDALHEVFLTSDYKPDLAVACEWRRTDYGIKKFITTDKRGPRWSKVLRRITLDIKTGIVIDDIDVRGLALRDARLRRPLPGGTTAVETIFVHTDEDVGTNDTVEFAYLTKGAVRSEIRLQDLAPEQRKKFDQAMAKEWRSWTEFQAVEVLSFSRAKELLDRGASPVGARWVHADKNAKKRNLEQTYDDIPLAAKSRLVVQGCQDAGRQWWLHLRAILVEQGWRESIYEPCLFMLRDSKGKLNGLLCAHVDDLFATGAGEQFERVMEIIKDKIRLSFQSDTFRYCGKVVEQDNQTFDIKIGQAATVEALEYITLEPHRRRKPNAPLTPTRPDLAVHASLGAQAMSGPKIRDIVAVNRAAKMAKDDVDFKLMFSSRLDWDSAIAFGCGGSSHGNIDDLTLGEKVKSQCGYIIGMASPDLETDATAIMHPLEWASATIKRVVRGSLAAECNGFLTTAESAEFLKHAIAEISDPGYSSYQFDPFFDGKHLLLLTDANGLVTSLEKDGGQPADKRVRILMAQIRQLLCHDVLKQEREGDDWRICVRWIDTKLMIADYLTKSEAERSFLLERLSEGRWCLAQTKEMLAAKAAAGEARRARKARPGDAEG
ncbi:unnamed protein product [Prorocentrum cordatum]|uniref:Copia protein n=1 Tax=Prorocentrum cordatum TaxID=2364126 RepID=A0ABN9WR90_9DINO|nr:unnamed protein product [Polarella glacialis]